MWFLFLQVRYQTNEEYLKEIPEESENEAASPDAGEGAGIVLEIRPKPTSVSVQPEGDTSGSGGVAVKPTEEIAETKLTAEPV